MRAMGLMSAAIIVARLACPAALAVAPDKPRQPLAPNAMPPGNGIEPTGIRFASAPRTTHHPHKLKVVRLAAGKVGEPPSEDVSELSPGAITAQEHNVGEIAVEHGDLTFLMVDKSLGKILLFENGEPVFIGNALTGASTADRLPPNELKEAMARLNALQTKVTPAGRFTVTRGPLFDIKEIQGKDWGIAIHQVYLGIPSENRAARLRSARHDDKNITFGCINVAPETIRLLLRELPEKGPTVLYVLPRDATNAASYFTPHHS